MGLLLRATLALVMLCVAGLPSSSHGAQGSRYRWEYDVAVREAGYLDDSYCRRHVYGNNAAQFGCFDPHGDILFMRDGHENGKSVGIHWRTGYGRRGICRNLGGYGPIRQCDKDFKEGRIIEFRFGECDGDRFSCKRLRGWTRWTRWRRVRT